MKAFTEKEVFECWQRAQKKVMPGESDAIDCLTRELNAVLADDRVMSTAMAVKMENAVLQRELSRALATLELIENADRARGYPSGKEWTEVIKTIRETIAVIKTSECLR